LPQTDAPQALALSRRVETVFADNLKALQLSVSVSLDHGVANFPLDADNSDDLIRIADERLYQSKHAHQARTAEAAPRQPEAAPPQTAKPELERPSTAPAPGPISIEAKRPAEKPEKSEENVPAASPSTSEASSKASPTAPAQRAFTVPRKAERVSMTGTNAYAVLGEQGARRARVLDLGFGGVALELDSSESLTDNILAVLHVPILPPVRVNLKPVWSRRTDIGGYRVGCTFVS
jgi:hypothetical protein